LNVYFQPIALVLSYTASNQFGFTGIQPHVQMITDTRSLHIKNHDTINLKVVQYIYEEWLFIPTCSTKNGSEGMMWREHAAGG
jgi:hypothetical protein